MDEVDGELSYHLAACSMRVPYAEFTDSALPWFRAHPELAIEPLIALVREGRASSVRAARALGVLRAEAAVPALRDMLMGKDFPSTQGAAARALWTIGNEEAIDALKAAITHGSHPAHRTLSALAPLGERDPCPLVALGLESDDDLVLYYARRAKEKCGC